MAYLLTALAIGCIWFSAKYKWWKPAISLAKPRILMYHMVREHVPGARFNGLRVKPALFERQVSWLARKGWQFYFLSELLEAETAPEKAVVLTFDDGFEDNYRNVLPVLKKYGAKATLFLVEERFDNDWSVKKKAHHSSGELMREPKLTDEQVREMIDSGCFEIGGHSLTHADFSKLELDAKQRELCQSKQVLEEKFAVDIKTYAYPFGIYSDEDRELVKDHGYACAVTTIEGIDDDIQQCRYDLKRVKVAGKKNFLHFKTSLRLGLKGLL
ncbi:MAG: polysaccharide deacetylase family protein [Cellvibrionaceae bacterium]|nr:polysaccharide deacetylase family protein [Cellvibrionaceae bacterium]